MNEGEKPSVFFTSSSALAFDGPNRSAVESLEQSGFKVWLGLHTHVIEFMRGDRFESDILVFGDSMKARDCRKVCRTLKESDCPDIIVASITTDIGCDSRGYVDLVISAANAEFLGPVLMSLFTARRQALNFSPQATVNFGLCRASLSTRP